MGNDISTSNNNKSCKIILQNPLIPTTDSSYSYSSTTTINNPATGDISTIISSPSETWSQLSRRTIENDYLSKPNLLLPLLLQKIIPPLHPEPSGSGGGRRRRRFAAYRLRYDLGLATIIKPLWNTTNNGEEVVVEDGFVDVNVSLRPSNKKKNGQAIRAESELLFAPHASILASLGNNNDGVENTTTTHVEFQFDLIGYHHPPSTSAATSANNNGGAAKTVLFVPPYPMVQQTTSVITCKEHEHFDGCIDDYKLEKFTAENGVLPKRCVNDFGKIDAVVEEVKEKEVEGSNNQEDNVGVAEEVMEAQEQKCGESDYDDDGASHDVVEAVEIAQNERGEAKVRAKVYHAPKVPHNDEGNNEEPSKKELGPKAAASEGKPNVRVIPRNGKATTSSSSSPSPKKSPASSTAKKSPISYPGLPKEITVTTTTTTTTTNGSAKVKKALPAKERQQQQQQQQSKKKKVEKVTSNVEESPTKKKKMAQAATATAKSSSGKKQSLDSSSDEKESIKEQSSKAKSVTNSKKDPPAKKKSAPPTKSTKEDTGTTTADTTDKKQQRKLQSSFPSEPAGKDLPAGWTKCRIKRDSGRVDVFFYSPKLQLKFRSKPEVKKFSEAVVAMNGDEEAAYEQLGKRKGGGGASSKKPAASGVRGVKKEEDVDANKKTGKSKRKREESATKQALDEMKSETKNDNKDDDDDDEHEQQPKKKSKKSMKELIASNGGKNSTTKKKVTTTKKKKKVADPNKPNRPMNAFYRFSADYRPKMKKENPDLTSAELMSDIRDLYKNVGEDMLKPYKDAAAEALEKYKADLEAYNTGQKVDE